MKYFEPPAFETVEIKKEQRENRDYFRENLTTEREVASRWESFIVLSGGHWLWGSWRRAN